MFTLAFYRVGRFSILLIVYIDLNEKELQYKKRGVT